MSDTRKKLTAHLNSGEKMLLGLATTVRVTINKNILLSSVIYRRMIDEYKTEKGKDEYKTEKGKDEYKTEKGKDV